MRTGPSAGLPDCRAYELVSPPSENGWFPYVEPDWLDASHLVFSSLGAPGNPNGDPQGSGADYSAERTPGGWAATPIDPPSSQYFNGQLRGETTDKLDVSQDFSKGLFLVYPRSGKPVDERLILRQADGTFAEVGPTVSPATVAGWSFKAKVGDSNFPRIHYVGGSRDLSHVLFTLGNPISGLTSTNWHWPGDTTKEDDQESLYEYVGTGNTTPTLVGVDNAGHLISQCGTGLGDDNRNGAAAEQNAISADGSTVFFKSAAGSRCGAAGPPAEELFARINQSRTVPISEPSAADCSACNTAIPADANFQGASADGSRVFFLTTQQLLPADTDTSTDLYLYDFNAPAGERVVQVSGGGHGDATPGSGANVQGVAAVSNDGSHVYFVAQGVLTTDPNNQGQVAQAGNNNLYVYERDAQFSGGHTTFIAALSGSDQRDWSLLQDGPAETTPDGRFLLLASNNDLTPDASGSGTQLYRYDSQTGSLVRVTIGQNGFNNNGNTGDSFFFSGPSRSRGWLAAPQGVGISDDGSYVFFAGFAGLTPQAQNNQPIGQEGQLAENVYEYHNGQVYLISDGQDTSLALEGSTTQLIGASPSGGDVFITSGDPLVSQDGNSQKDVYDVRVGGGFSPGQGAPTCSGDGCQALTTPLSEQTPGSSTFSGPGNPAPSHVGVGGKRAGRRHCGKGRTLRHGRCVKAKARHGKRAKRSSMPSKRGGAR